MYEKPRGSQERLMITRFPVDISPELVLTRNVQLLIRGIQVYHMGPKNSSGTPEISTPVNGKPI